MSWKGGSGRIGISTGTRVTTYSTSIPTEEMVLLAEQSVVVSDTDFKLVSKS
jgi:hypothetical protein